MPCERRKGKAGEVRSEEAGTVSGEDDAEESEPCRCAERRRLGGRRGRMRRWMWCRQGYRQVRRSEFLEWAGCLASGFRGGGGWTRGAVPERNLPRRRC